MSQDQDPTTDQTEQGEDTTGHALVANKPEQEPDDDTAGYGLTLNKPEPESDSLTL